MYDISKKDYIQIIRLLEVIERILSYSKDISSAKEFYNNRLVFDASLMNLILLSEIAEELSEVFRIETEDEILWTKVRGFKNMIIPNYSDIKTKEIWQIISTYLVTMHVELEDLLAENKGRWNENIF